MIVAPEDLIISKLDWMRETRSEVQLADVRNLLRSVPDLDNRYLAQWTDAWVSDPATGRRLVTDTPPEVMNRYRAMLLARSPEERLKMGCSMDATARALARGAVLAQDPHALAGLPAPRDLPSLLRPRVRGGSAGEDRGVARSGSRPRRRPERRRCILRLTAVGGGFLRTGCGPGPLEPDLGNSSVGNTATTAAPPFGRGLFRFRPDLGPRRGMKISVNGKGMEVADGLSVEALLAELGVKREFTAVAVNREVTPRGRYAETWLRDGDRVEIVRPMGGG